MTKAATSTTAGKVTVSGLKSSTAKSAVIQKTIKINGYTFKVTAIKAKAFYNKSKLKTITINSTTITSIGSKAFSKVYKKATIKLPSTKYSKYKKMIKAAGAPSGVQYKKIS